MKVAVTGIRAAPVIKSDSCLLVWGFFLGVTRKREAPAALESSIFPALRSIQGLDINQNRVRTGTAAEHKPEPGQDTCIT